MKTSFWILLAVFGFCCASTAATLPFTVLQLDSNSFRYSYDIGGISFAEDQELEVDFETSRYLNLWNAVAPVGFDVLLFQPDDPPGAAGRLSALAMAERPAAPGLISVDVAIIPAAGMAPRQALGSQPQEFAINQLDEMGIIVSTVTTGQTSSAVPEPGTLGLMGISTLFVCATLARRRLRNSS